MIEGIGGLIVRLPSRKMAVETMGSPRFLGNPRDHCPCSSTPVGPAKFCGTKCNATDAALEHVHNEGSWRLSFSGLNRTAFDLAVYASQGKSPNPTQDSLLAAGPALPGGIGYPQGSNERFPSFEALSPFPSFSWRKDVQNFLGLLVRLCRVATET